MIEYEIVETSPSFELDIDTSTGVMTSAADQQDVGDVRVTVRASDKVRKIFIKFFLIRINIKNILANFRDNLSN